MKSDKKEKIKTDSGELVDAQAPVIISASRSTDIPAFYSKWFFNRLERGYCVWYNPFNQKPSYISFSNCKVIVFWTKNPKPILDYLPRLDQRGIHYYFQYTLNDYEKEGFEPHVPSLEERIQTFQKLSSVIGKERVIWRFDPIITTQEISPREILKRIWHIGNRLKGYTEKLVFSFVDINAYRKVQNNLVRETNSFKKETILTAEPSKSHREEIIAGLVKIREAWAAEGWKISMATCGEADDYKYAEIEHNRCIDGALMERLFEKDVALMYYLRTGELPEPDLFGEVPPLPLTSKNLKDKGQRQSCGCMVSKDIGMYNTCRHFCVYCYANTSKECVKKNALKHSETSESIID